MKPWLSIVLILVSGCTQNDFVRFTRDLESGPIAELSVEDRGEKVSCEPSAGQETLKAWILSLQETDTIASWPDPGQYVLVSFDNGNKYSVHVFLGDEVSRYSIAYMAGVRVGDTLRIKDVCVTKGAHNNALNTDGLGQRAFGASPKPAG